MSKRETTIRHNLIINKLRKCPSSFVEISDYLSLESEYQQYNLNVSKRTFQRDIVDIASVYDIEIKYDKPKGVYYLEYDEKTERNERLLEALDTFNALNIAERLSDKIYFENRLPKGTENLHGILHAIKNKFQMIFTYCKFWDDIMTERVVNPIALKEFENRWYVIAEDISDNNIKSFALDRLSNLEITRKNFIPNDTFNVEEYFHYCFGITSPNNKKPEKIRLSFNSFQGKYIKTLPLHHTQKIIVDNENELLIELEIIISHEFIMELLSLGDTVKVIKPTSLIKELKNIYTSALEQY